MATELICPKCQGLMRTYERSGVTVDQCADCRGIFLDRGELERLVDAEQGWQRSHPAPSREREPEHQRYDPRHDDARRYGEGQQVRRKKSFFDELFD
jgi:Zn-finger nucleic acid-binding protein